MPTEPLRYVSRGGLKLAAALEAFRLEVDGWSCADLGANVGGFTDCLLQRHAARVYAVDTGYGQLAYKLRQDPRVVVMERTNALHVDPRKTEFPGVPGGFTPCTLVVIDLAWTRQAHAIPAALRWLPPPGVMTEDPKPAPHVSGRIITLIKPHYEAEKEVLKTGGDRGVLAEREAEAIVQRVLKDMPTLGAKVLGYIRSPIRGGAGKGRTGNVEYLAMLERA